MPPAEGRPIITHKALRMTRPSGCVNLPVDGSRKTSLVGESDQDAVRLLLQNLQMNGILPRNEQTDSSLKKLSGDVFDMNDEEKRDQLIKQLSEKLSAEQIEKLKGDANLLQTMTFAVFLIRFAKTSLKNHTRILRKSIGALSDRLGEPRLDLKTMTELASNLTF